MARYKHKETRSNTPTITKNDDEEAEALPQLCVHQSTQLRLIHGEAAGTAARQAHWRQQHDWEGRGRRKRRLGKTGARARA